MKKLSVLILVAILGLVLWALPAGAEKIRLTDAELDGIAAGFLLQIMPPTPIPCCVFLDAVGAGVLGPGPGLAGGLVLSSIIVPTGTIGPARVSATVEGTASKPLGIATGSVFGAAVGPKGAAVPFLFSFP
jgi:hypothetical protein